MKLSTIHPKVSAAAIVGALYALVVVVAGQMGVQPDPTVEAVVGPIVAVLAAYLKGGPPAAAAVAEGLIVKVDVSPIAERVAAELTARLAEVARQPAQLASVVPITPPPAPPAA